MRAESLFLQACAVDHPADWSGREDAVRALSAGDWNAVRAYAVMHGFAGLLARNLAWASEACAIPIPVIEPLESLRRGQLVQHLARRAAARRVCVALESQGIPFIVFKGIALAEEVYGDLSLRGFRDLDVMVPLDKVEAAYALCMDLGYRLTLLDHVRDYVRADAHAAGMVHADGSGVDLHWTLALNLVAPRHIETIWENTLPAKAGASLPGLRLAPEMMLVHLARHFHAHEYCSPKPLVDFFVAARRLAPLIDADRLAHVSSALGLQPVVEIAAGLSERCFVPEALPACVRGLATAPAARTARRLVHDDMLANSARRPRIDNWARFLGAAGGLRFALPSLSGILVPGKLTLAQFFGRAYVPAMYPRYYWRQLVKTVTLSTK